MPEQFNDWRLDAVGENAHPGTAPERNNSHNFERKNMNQNLLDHIVRSLKNKPPRIRKESKADIVMKKMFVGF